MRNWQIWQIFISLINSENNNGDKFPPWETPEGTFEITDLHPKNFTH